MKLKVKVLRSPFRIIMTHYILSAKLVSTWCDTILPSVPFSFPLFPWGSRRCFIPPFSGGLLGPNPVTVGEGQGTPWMSRQLIAGPLLMAVAATQVPTAHQEQFCGSVSIFKDTLGSCSSVSRAGGLLIARLLVRILAPLGWNWTTCRSIPDTIL